MSNQSAFVPTAVGVTLAATGVAHFVVPQAFEAITVQAFPKDTSTWIKRNGFTETVVGAAIAIPATRKAGWVALGAYVAFLGSQIVLANN